jgi:hypothetical protein
LGFCLDRLTCCTTKFLPHPKNVGGHVLRSSDESNNVRYVPIAVLREHTTSTINLNNCFVTARATEEKLQATTWFVATAATIRREDVEHA